MLPASETTTIAILSYVGVRDPGFVGETDGLQSRELFSLYLSKADLPLKETSYEFQLYILVPRSPPVKISPSHSSF